MYTEHMIISLQPSELESVDQASIAPSSQTGTRFSVFSPEDNEVLRQLFLPVVKQCAEAGHMVKSTEIYNRCGSSAKGRDIMATYSKKQIYNKVKSFYNNLKYHRK